MLKYAETSSLLHLLFSWVLFDLFVMGCHGSESQFVNAHLAISVLVHLLVQRSSMLLCSLAGESGG